MAAQVTTLNNGIRVVSLNMPALETASVGIYVDVGTRFEHAGQVGISHMFEHMVFKGTNKRSARGIAEEIEAVGGHLNAYTTRDMTAYYARVLKADLGLAVDLLSDLLSNARFADAEVLREQDVICQEIGQANDTPDDIIFDHLQSVAFKDQPLGFSILGTPENVRSINAQALRDYRGQHYQGGALVVAAAGKVVHEDLVAHVEEHLGHIERGVERTPEIAKYTGGDHRDIRSLEQVHLAMAFEAVSFPSSDIYALQLYATILGGGMSSRLFQEVREERGLAYAVFSDVAAHADTGLLSVYAGTSAEDAPEALQVISDCILSMRDRIGETELDRARAQLKAALAMSLESSTALSEQLGRHMLMFGRPIPAAEILARVDEVREADVRRVADELLSRGPLSFATVGPASHLPNYDELSALFKN